MKISSYANNTSFKGASINIAGLSDTHGTLKDAPRGCNSIIRSGVFSTEKKGNGNYLIIGGDWFISGAKKGFLSRPNGIVMDFQLDILNKFIERIKKHSPFTETIVVPGNHEFDGGMEIFKNAIKKLKACIIGTNIDFKKSDNLDDDIISSKIDFVEDDKDPNVKHAVLNLGVVPINMKNIHKNLGLELIDNVDKRQKEVKPEDYQKTVDEVCRKVEEFREKYKNGTVILTCHTGMGFADECAKRGGFDLILDGHEHKDEVRMVGATPIAALSSNFQKIVTAKIKIDDDGNKIKTVLRNLYPQKARPDKELEEFHDEIFKEDLKPIYTIKSQTQRLDTWNIRSENNQLANFVTDAILTSIKEKDPSVQIFGINAASIREGFKTGNRPTVTSLEVINCLNGIQEEDANVFVTPVSGKELAKMILEDLLFFEKRPDKNPISHYSGISVNKTGILKAFARGTKEAELCNFITLKETKEKIKPNNIYKIANPEKYFVKSNNPEIKALFNKSHPLNSGVHELFRNYFAHNQETTLESETRIY